MLHRGQHTGSKAETMVDWVRASHCQLVKQDRGGSRAGDELLRLGIIGKEEGPHELWGEADYDVESVGRAVWTSRKDGMGGVCIV